ncbi:MAG: hypothetical protein FWC28_00710 [Proteobacteria bacterium]|nr:hypothetical protein [Cystobacterineae bacterium]MCL2313763.1 hypothetical protein [Pseudomonadota bacterium]
MRFFRLTLFALFWVAIGLCLGIVPIGGTTVWQKLYRSLQNFQKRASAASSASSTSAPKPAPPPVSKTAGKVAAMAAGQTPTENYAAEERASIDSLIRGKQPAR